MLLLKGGQACAAPAASPGFSLGFSFTFGFNMDQAFVLESLQELVSAASAPLKLLQKRALSLSLSLSAAAASAAVSAVW